MMRWILCVCCLLSACGVLNEQSIYEGVRSNQRAKSAGNGQDEQALPSYERYSKERETLKK